MAGIEEISGQRGHGYYWVRFNGIPLRVLFLCCALGICVSFKAFIREVKHHVYVKRQTRICRLLFIISTHKIKGKSNHEEKGHILVQWFLAFFIAK